MNDPFEAVFCHVSLNKLANSFDEEFYPKQESISQHINLMKNRTGIISFTENKESLLMWAHYANEHKGIVAGVAYDPIIGSIFDNLLKPNSLFCSSVGAKYSLFDGTPKPVSYRKGLRYKNDKLDYDYSNIFCEGVDRFLYEVFLQKSEEWIYEQEHRVILRLEQADRVIVPIPNLGYINNHRIKENIINASYTKVDNQSYTIDLFKISDETERICIAKELAKLSESSATIYLMKLSSSSINNCIIGLNSKIEKADIQGKHARAVGYLDIWKAIKKVDEYRIDFEEI